MAHLQVVVDDQPPTARRIAELQAENRMLYNTVGRLRAQRHRLVKWNIAYVVMLTAAVLVVMFR